MPAEPTAATSGAPRRPIQIISVRFYAIWMKEVAIIGLASFISAFGMLPESRSICRFIFLPPVFHISLSLIHI